jgi:iron complex outermembrane receptor protein
MTMLRQYFTIPILLYACSSGEANAQRTNQNTTAQSTDAFGHSVGNERNGLYSHLQVRGFNPVDAGNVRINGLYADLIDRVPPRLSEENVIRVGITALRYPFPAPTGLVDYAINKPADNPQASFDISNGTANGAGIGGTFQFDLPLFGKSVGLNAGVGFRRAERPEGGAHSINFYGATLALRPETNSEILIFSGGNLVRGEEARATLFPAGTDLPPKVPRGTFLGQTWTDRNSNILLHGALIRHSLGVFRLEAGLFNSSRSNATNYSDLLTGVTPDGRAANRIVIASAGTKDEATSGEVRLVRTWLGERYDHQLTLSVRGRDKNRLFGGNRRISLGPSNAAIADFRAKPELMLGAHDVDTVRQRTIGVAYNLRRR